MKKSALKVLYIHLPSSVLNLPCHELKRGEIHVTIDVM